jgi:hypothetical protein
MTIPHRHVKNHVLTTAHQHHRWYMVICVAQEMLVTIMVMKQIWNISALISYCFWNCHVTQCHAPATGHPRIPRCSPLVLLKVSGNFTRQWNWVDVSRLPFCVSEWYIINILAVRLAMMGESPLGAMIVSTCFDPILGAGCRGKSSPVFERRCGRRRALTTNWPAVVFKRAVYSLFLFLL